MIQLERHGLCEAIGKQQVGPVPFMQSIDECIESCHSRAGFSRERMGPARAAAFEAEAQQLLQRTYVNGTISFQVIGSVVWGRPLG
jgi:hypothetical protein